MTSTFANPEGIRKPKAIPTTPTAVPIAIVLCLTFSDRNLSGKIAYVMNLCTLPDYRKQGIARLLMQKVIEWIKKNDLTVVSLHATEMGRKMYEELGFKETNEMRLKFTD